MRREEKATWDDISDLVYVAILTCVVGMVRAGSLRAHEKEHSQGPPRHIGGARVNYEQRSAHIYKQPIIHCQYK